MTRVIVLDPGDGASGTALAGTGRRFVSTVSTSSVRRTREVELEKTIRAVRAGRSLLSPQAHTLLYRARRGAQVALAISEVFGRQSDLESLQARNLSAPLQGGRCRALQGAAVGLCLCRRLSFCAYMLAMLAGEGEPVEDGREPDYLFDTPQVRAEEPDIGAGRALAGASDEVAQLARARAFLRVAIDGLISRKARFTGLASFEARAYPHRPGRFLA